LGGMGDKSALLSKSPEPTSKNYKKIKCVVVGDGAVGKTCMLISYTTNTFPKEYVPTIFDNFFTNVIVDSQIVNFHLWDTAGQDEYDKLRYLAYPETDCYLVCFDITRQDSLMNVKIRWIPELAQYSPGVPIIVVGTKQDLRTDPAGCKKLGITRLIGSEEGKRIAEDIGAKAYMECSALTQSSLKEVFEQTIRCGLVYKYSKQQQTAGAPRCGGCIIL